MQTVVRSLAPVLPHPAILFLGFAILAGRPQQVRLFQWQKVIARKSRTDHTGDLQSLATPVCAAQETLQNHPGVRAAVAVGVVIVSRLRRSFLLVAASSIQLS